MTPQVARVLGDKFVSIVVTKFKKLSSQDRTRVGSQKGMAIECRMILNEKTTDALENTLREDLANGAMLGELFLAYLLIGGRH